MKAISFLKKLNLNINTFKDGRYDKRINSTST
jgi:hypothetical protein